MPRQLRWLLVCSAVCATAMLSLSAQQMSQTPARQAGEGEGPFERLVIRGVTVIDGTGAPPRGPMDVVVQNNRIAEVSSVGFPGVPISERGRPQKGAREIDGAGWYLMPGFVDAHVHCGGGQARDPEYVYKLWLAHGVTTVRGVPCGSMDWDLNQRDLSAKNRLSRLASFRITVRSAVKAGIAAGRRRLTPRVSGCASRPRRALTASSWARTTPRSWQRCSTRPRS